MACALVARGLHQDLNVIKKMRLTELFLWAQIAAKMEGVNFN